MKTKSQLILILTTFLSLSAFAQVERTTATAAAGMTKKESMKPSVEYKATTDDIKSSLGMVATMFKQYPQEALPGAWEEMKSVQLNPNSAIPGKYKELIGLAVSAQIPCKYCVYFHSKFAVLQGATEKEMREAIAVAGATRKWSAHLYGSQMNMENFKKNVDQIVANAKAAAQKNTPAPMVMAAADITTADLAMKDAQNIFGVAPEFMREYHKPAVPGAWKELRDFHMSTATALPMKMKDLISMAVAAQIPCEYCTYFDGEFAKLDGASTEEIKEAVAVAGLVRNWSTFLNGIAMNEKQFHREVDQMVAFAKRKMSGVKTDRQASATH